MAQAKPHTSENCLGYDALNLVLLDLQRALDLQPGRTSAKSLLSDTYMEQWRLAMAKENFPLAENARREVIRQEGGEPNRYSSELNGWAVVAFLTEPANTQLYLFEFVPIETHSASGAVTSRLVPIPYDLSKRDVVLASLQSETTRAQFGPAVLPGAHTIFNLQTADQSLISQTDAGDVHLPPGSYLVLAKSPNREDTRVPIFVPSERSVTVLPFLVFHDEISMGEYAEFLKALVAQGKRKEAESRAPRDFGKKIAIMGNDGSLTGINTKHPAWFLASAVRGISFNDVQAYIDWRSQRDGLSYRLPTELEWEGACRGADGRRYSWGNQYGKGFAFILQGYNDTGGDRSWKWEDFKDESPWGVHDLAGGAAEWTASTYNPSAKTGDAEFGQFAIRGNAWSLPPVGLECAFRTSGQPDYFHPTIGFRLALDYPPPKTSAITVTEGSDHHH